MPARRAIFADELVLQLHDADGYVCAAAVSAAGRPFDVSLSLCKCGGRLRGASPAVEAKQPPQLEQTRGVMGRGVARWSAIHIAKGCVGTDEGEYVLTARVAITGRLLELEVAKFQYTAKSEDEEQAWRDTKAVAERRLAERREIVEERRRLAADISRAENSLEQLRGESELRARALDAFEDQFGSAEQLERQVEEMSRLRAGSRGEDGQPKRKRQR